jgi:hypothetical protein
MPPVATPLPTEKLPLEARDMLDMVKVALADQLGVDVASLQVLSIQSVVWPDASLGCPRPNTGYLQVETPGYLISLGADGDTYLFHTDLTSNYLVCEDGEPQMPSIPVTPSDIQDGEPYIPAN